MANQQHLMREEELPQNLEFVERPPLVAGSAAPPTQQGVDRYQGAILSAPLGLETDTAHSQLPGANPVYRLMPTSIAGSPASNAAIQSTAAKTIAVTPGPSTTVEREITLDIPNIFTPGSQTVTLPGPLAFSLAPEPTGTFLRAPLPGLTGLQTLAQAQGNGNIGISATPIASPSFGLFFQAANASPQNIPSGFTQLNGGDLVVAYGTITGTAPVGAGTSEGVFVDWVSGLAIFNGPAPTFIQSKNSSSHVGTLTYTSNNTAGNTLIIFMQCLDFGAAADYSLVISDSNRNNYVQLVNQRQPAVGSAPVVQQAVFIATNCVGGPNAVSFNFSGNLISAPLFSIVATEFGPLLPGASIPLFGPLSPSDIPPVNLSTTGNGGIGGILPVLNGGTGSDLSVTGGTSQFLKQSVSGGVITPVRPDYPDLAGAAGQLATKYNGVSLVSNGIPSEVAKVDLTAQAANIGATTLYVVPASGAGMYRVSSYIVMTTAASLTSTLPTVQLVYTDNDSNVSVTMDATPVSASAGLGQTGALNTNSAGSAASGVIAVNVKAGTTIQYQTVNYASNAAGMQYALHIKLEAL